MVEEKVSEKKSMKKQLIHNVIELAIGGILLWMCFGYIQTHPAEKVSFFSGYKVIYQQTEIFFQNVFGNNGDLLKQKYNLESYYQALITLAEEKKCIDPEVVKDLEETYAALQAEPKNTLEHTLSSYIEKEYKFDDILRQDCEVSVIPSDEEGIDNSIIDNVEVLGGDILEVKN